MEQLSIFKFDDKEDCIESLLEAQRALAWAMIPEEFIKQRFTSATDRSAVKRLREKVISAGYKLLMQLDHAIKDPRFRNSLMFRENTIILWNHLDMHVRRVNEYIEAHTRKPERVEA